MPLSTELKASYEAVLHDLEAEQAETHQQLAQHQNRLKELHHSILTLRKKLDADPPLPTSTIPLRQPDKKYAFLSVRWAILDLLAESEAKTTGEIADALLKAGLPTKAANFANNVSAVLSNMMKEGKHKEVRQLTDGRWELTDNGHRAIEYIRTMPKFQAALRNAAQFAK